MVVTRLHKYAGFSILFSSEEKKNASQLKTTSNFSCHTGGGEDDKSSIKTVMQTVFLELLSSSPFIVLIIKDNNSLCSAFAQ